MAILEDLLEAVKENTATMKELIASGAATASVPDEGTSSTTKSTGSKSTGSKSTGSKSTGSKSTKTADKKSTPQHTAEEVRDMIVRVKDECGEDKAKELINSTGHEKLAQLVADAEKWDDAMAAAQAAIDEAGAEGDDENGGL